MSEFNFYSEREGSKPPLDIEALSQSFWDGFISLIRTLVKDGSLAEEFPLHCFEHPLPVD